MTPWWLPRSDRSSSFLPARHVVDRHVEALRLAQDVLDERVALHVVCQQDALHRHVRAERLDDDGAASALYVVCHGSAFVADSVERKVYHEPVPRHGNSPARRGAATRNPRGRTPRRPVGRRARTPWASWPAHAARVREALLGRRVRDHQVDAMRRTGRHGLSARPRLLPFKAAFVGKATGRGSGALSKISSDRPNTASKEPRAPSRGKTCPRPPEERTRCP